MLIKAIAIDDEAPGLEVVKSFASKVPFIHLEKTFTNPKEGLEYIFEYQPDLIFLDIHMPQMSGVELAKIIQPLGKTFIFTTAYREYALEGYELQALDYLLKPFSFERFLTALNRAYQEIIQKNGEETSVFIKDSYDWVRVKLHEIRFIKSDSNLLFIHLENEVFSTRMTITEILEILPKDQYMRVHKSYIANLSAIVKIERHQVWIGKDCVPVASTYREMMESRLLKK
ncbi:LytR/AlgR family response regulator transcription factor [Litoribacter populi]|uniref:LytR/AlgR family response regulator transcription factor n=1 Tax=Litoribacter populi TaxID=2598460 RepID=UPI00118087B3|nr:response regulator transcription factor [Litoribacter populi]